jgi:hypothetical protein
MRYFLDCEFNQTVEPIQLMSMAVVREDGHSLYREVHFDEDKLDEWLRAHVLPLLTEEKISPSQLKADLEEFLKDDPEPEFWGYYADYDWYLFTRLWGFMDMPKRFPKLCFDVKQWAKFAGNPKLPPPLQPEHHALTDAKWNLQAWEFLRTRFEQGVELAVVDPNCDTEHCFWLRPDLRIFLDLPGNLTPTEAGRIADFVRTLPYTK